MDIHPILVVSATKVECAPTLRELAGRKDLSPCLYSGIFQGQRIEVLLTGIGSVATTFRLTQTLLQRPYSRAIAIGIAGSFSDDIPIGETVQITEDCFADLGIDKNGQFCNFRETGITCEDFDCDFISNPSPTLSPHQKVLGVTVQTVSGSKSRIDELVQRFQPQVETMENAAFFYVCRKLNIPFASFRAISNKVEPRYRENWRIDEAIKNVNETLAGILLSLENPAGQLFISLPVCTSSQTVY